MYSEESRMWSNTLNRVPILEIFVYSKHKSWSQGGSI